MPVRVDSPDLLDDDLVRIPKYPGKTNEQFTRLLVNLTLSAVRRPDGPRRVLDPMCGRGTTLTTALTLGHDAVGVEQDDKALEAAATFLRTYLRASGSSTPPTSRRSGGRVADRAAPRRLRLAGAVRPGAEPEHPRRDARESATLCGRRRFDAVVADAPYGVVHASAGRGRPARTASAPRGAAARGAAGVGRPAVRRRGARAGLEHPGTPARDAGRDGRRRRASSPWTRGRGATWPTGSTPPSTATCWSPSVHPAEASQTHGEQWAATGKQGRRPRGREPR